MQQRAPQVASDDHKLLDSGRADSLSPKRPSSVASIKAPPTHYARPQAAPAPAPDPLAGYYMNPAAMAAAAAALMNQPGQLQTGAAHPYAMPGSAPALIQSDQYRSILAAAAATAALYSPQGQLYAAQAPQKAPNNYSNDNSDSDPNNKQVALNGKQCDTTLDASSKFFSSEGSVKSDQSTAASINGNKRKGEELEERESRAADIKRVHLDDLPSEETRSDSAGSRQNSSLGQSESPSSEKTESNADLTEQANELLLSNTTSALAANLDRGSPTLEAGQQQEAAANGNEKGKLHEKPLPLHQCQA